jgi:hypothetical protein
VHLVRRRYIFQTVTQYTPVLLGLQIRMCMCNWQQHICLHSTCLLSNHRQQPALGQQALVLASWLCVSDHIRHAPHITLGLGRWPDRTVNTESRS